MRRIFILLVLAVSVALALVYAPRLFLRTSNDAVAALLPRETVFFAHVPDFSQTRDEWHRSDIYQLYAEPAVQDFLRKPLTRIPRAGSFSQTSQEIQQLDIKDGFMAVTSIANNPPKLVAGFRFRGSQDEAEKIIAGWRSQMLRKNAPGTTSETIDYQQHKIEVSTQGITSLATAYDGQWFFASNDTDELKAVLDRADGRAQDRQLLLVADENFHGAMAQMPATYAACLYVQPKGFVQKLAALRGSPGAGPGPDQGTTFDQIRSVSAAMRFENGKMHDVLFFGMPRQPQDGELTRNSIALATRDTFIYVATLLDVSKQFALVDPSPSASFLGVRLQKIGRGLAAAGITADDWKATFGSELGALADWRADTHWPTGLVTFPVKDAPRAKKIISVLAHVLDDDGSWVETDKNGVHYVSMPYSAGLFAFRPTLAVSDRFMVAGVDAASVEAAMQRSASRSSELANSETYKRAARTVPDPTNGFAYLDLGLLYTRLDASLRPMLLMGAAFMPAMSDYVDVGKLPPPEIVAKHLTPIVSSQIYNGKGYLAESVGSITINQSALGAVLLTGLGAWGYRQSGLSNFTGFGLPSLGLPGSGAPATTPPSGGWSGKGFKVPPATSPSPSETP